MPKHNALSNTWDNLGRFDGIHSADELKEQQMYPLFGDEDPTVQYNRQKELEWFDKFIEETNGG